MMATGKAGKGRDMILQGRWQVLAEDIVNPLGRGSFATVYKVLDNYNNQTYAIKQINIKSSPSRSIKQEVEALRMAKDLFNNSNLLKIIDSFTNQDNLYIVTEYCNIGDLDQYLEEHERLTEYITSKFVEQIILGVKALHDQNYLHRDLKLANILLSSNSGEESENEKYKLKIADLGFARSLKDKMQLATTICGTPISMAPEMWDDKPKYGTSVDIWSIGIMMYKLLVGKYPFESIAMKNIIHRGFYYLPRNLALSRNCIRFLLNCLQEKPEKRMPLDKLLTHPFITQAETNVPDFQLFNFDSNQLQLSTTSANFAELYPKNNITENVEPELTLIDQHNIQVAKGDLAKFN